MEVEQMKVREDKKKIVEQVFTQYDDYKAGELTPSQVQVLYGDIRMGGISLPQVANTFFVSYTI